MDSLPHSLQYTGKLLALVSGASRSTFPRPQTGHITHPFFTLIMTGFPCICNTFSPFSIKMFDY